MAPMYVYKCPDHNITAERLAAVEDRDKIKIKCQKCNKAMKRQVTAANLADPPHRTQAILSNGQKVSGDWKNSRGR
jgi:hypothetical protein